MGYTTKISDYEIERSTTVGPLAEGIEVEKPKKSEPAESKAKVVTPEEKAPAKTSRSAKTK